MPKNLIKPFWIGWDPPPFWPKVKKTFFYASPYYDYSKASLLEHRCFSFGHAIKMLRNSWFYPKKTRRPVSLTIAAGLLNLVVSESRLDSQLDDRQGLDWIVGPEYRFRVFPMSRFAARLKRSFFVTHTCSSFTGVPTELTDRSFKEVIIFRVRHLFVIHRGSKLTF